jgi:hypothetical protein
VPFFTVDRDRTGVRPESSAQDLHERFAGAILAEKRMNFAATNVHRNAMQDLKAHKAFFDSRDLKNACHATASPPLVRRSRNLSGSLFLLTLPTS